MADEVPLPDAPAHWSRSATLKTLRRVLGPLAYLRTLPDGRHEAGYLKGNKRLPLGRAKTYYDLIDFLFLRPLKAREVAQEEAEKEVEKLRLQQEANPPAGAGPLTAVEQPTPVDLEGTPE
jgi:hypothetical protein